MRPFKNVRRVGGFVAVAVAAAVGAALVVGCQTYDFEPVIPLALAQHTSTVLIAPSGLPPNMMFLLDRSGSMKLPFTAFQADGVTKISACFTDPSDGGTPGPCGNSLSTTSPTCSPTNCPSRWDTVTTTATNFLTGGNAPNAQMGVSFFPNWVGAVGFCDATSHIDVPLGANNNNAIVNAINGVGSASGGQNGGLGGGTPTAASVLYTAQNGGFASNPGRANYIVLMTDGLPNCDSNFPPANSYTSNPSACNCVDASGNLVNDPQECTSLPILDCNDYAQAAADIGQAASPPTNVKTIVVGFGDAASAGTIGVQSLQAMAVAGGFSRYCYTDGGECSLTGGADGGADTACLTNNPSTASALCQNQFFQATNSTQLAAALRAITIATSVVDPCHVGLNPIPSNPQLVSVVVTDNGVTTSYPYPSSLWSFVGATDGGAGGSLTFNDVPAGTAGFPASGYPLCTYMTTAAHTISYVVRVADVIQ
jgi:hypothetical protein